MPLVYTTTTGGDPNVVELSTPNQNVERALLQRLTTDIVANTSGLPGSSLSAALLSIVGNAVPRAPIVTAFGYTAGANLVLELLPTGHGLGLYIVTYSAVVRTAAATGSLTRSYQFNAPGFGAASASVGGAAQLTTLGPVGLQTAVALISDGTAPLNMTLNPAAVTGAPIVDIYAAALLLGNV
jgi:hypothetical protein